MMFGVMWGYPFLVSGQGLSRRLAAVLMARAGAVRDRVRRDDRHGDGAVSRTTAAGSASAWSAWPAPCGPRSCCGRGRRRCGCWWFWCWRSHRPGSPRSCRSTSRGRSIHRQRLGSAIGLVNVGGFAGTLISILAIGLVLQLASPGGSTDYSLTAFKVAFATQYVFWAVGIAQTLRWRRRTERLLAERDPDALEALRRGINLPPPT